jgi:hypothetical protein
MSDEEKDFSEKMRKNEAIAYCEAGNVALMDAMKNVTVGSMLLKHVLDLGFLIPPDIVSILTEIRNTLDAMIKINGQIGGEDLKSSGIEAIVKNLCSAMEVDVPDKDKMN